MEQVSVLHLESHRICYAQEKCPKMIGILQVRRFVKGTGKCLDNWINDRDIVWRGGRERLDFEFWGVFFGGGVGGIQDYYKVENRSTASYIMLKMICMNLYYQGAISCGLSQSQDKKLGQGVTILTCL